MADSYDATYNMPGYVNLADVSVSKGKRQTCFVKVKKNVLGKPIGSIKRRECDESGCRTVKEVDRRVKGAVVQAYDCGRKRIRVNNGYSVQDMPYDTPYGTGYTQRVVPHISEQTIVSGDARKKGKPFFVRNQGELNQRLLKDMYSGYGSESESDSYSSSSEERPRRKSKSKSKAKSAAKPKSKSKSKSKKSKSKSKPKSEAKSAGNAPMNTPEPLNGGDSKTKHHSPEHESRYRNIQDHARSKGYIPVATERMTDEFGREIIRHRYIKFSGSDHRSSRPEFIATVDGSTWTSMGDASMYFSNGVFQPTLYYSSFSPSERVFITPTYESDGYGISKPSFYERAYGSNYYPNNEVFVSRNAYPSSYLYRDNIAALPAFPGYGVPMQPIGSLGNGVFPRFRFDPKDMDLSDLLATPALYPFAAYYTKLATSLGYGNDAGKSIRMMEAELWDSPGKGVDQFRGQRPSMMPPALYARIFPNSLTAPYGVFGSYAPVPLAITEDPFYKMYDDGSYPSSLSVLINMYNGINGAGDASISVPALPSRLSIRLVEGYFLHSLHTIQKDQNKLYLAGNLNESQKDFLRNPQPPFMFSGPSGLQSYFFTQPAYAQKTGFVAVQPLNPPNGYNGYSGYNGYGYNSYLNSVPRSQTVIFPRQQSLFFGGGAAQPQAQATKAAGAIPIQQQPQQQKKIEIVSMERIPKRIERR